MCVRKKKRILLMGVVVKSYSKESGFIRSHKERKMRGKEADKGNVQDTAHK